MAYEPTKPATPAPTPAAPRPENIAETLARELPEPRVLFVDGTPQDGISHVAVPRDWEVKSLDNERMLARPRRTRAHATLHDADSFLVYVGQHKGASTAVWCDFNPASYALSFTAVVDEHGNGATGWREHTANFTPRTSVEWDIWVTSHNGKQLGQVAFAEFLESNEKDIAGGKGLPSSLDMMTMATNFEATADKRIKSRVRLQSGGVALEYVDTDNEATIGQMKLFERFQIGIPVFWEMPEPGKALAAWPIEARLKYSIKQGGATFWYQLIRPDIVHETAALALINKMIDGLGDVPLRMGTCKSA